MSHNVRSGGLLLLVLAALVSPAVLAHGDEVHAEAASVVSSGNSPQRLADGRVLLPKEAQRRLGIRTLVAQEIGRASCRERV